MKFYLLQMKIKKPLDVIIAEENVEHFKTQTGQKLIVLERALDTTKKWNLKHPLGDNFNTFEI